MHVSLHAQVRHHQHVFGIYIYIHRFNDITVDRQWLIY